MTQSGGIFRGFRGEDGSLPTKSLSRLDWNINKFLEQYSKYRNCMGETSHSTGNLQEGNYYFISHFIRQVLLEDSLTIYRRSYNQTTPFQSKPNHLVSLAKRCLRWASTPFPDWKKNTSQSPTLGQNLSPLGRIECKFWCSKKKKKKKKKKKMMIMNKNYTS